MTLEGKSVYFLLLKENLSLQMCKTNLNCVWPFGALQKH